jgi:hypothetical protein
VHWQSRDLSGAWSLYDYEYGLYKLVQFKRLKNHGGGDPKKSKVDFCEPCDDGREEDNERLAQSISRTKSRIFEIAHCNEFQYFCTLTMNSEKRDRFDLNGFVKDFGQFVRDLNKKRVEGQKIEYLLIPEEHKNGAWHFHGLLRGFQKGELKRNEYGYLNWNEYSEKFGFFSCSKVKKKENACRYITKYITKDMLKTSIPNGAHLFYCSQGLKRKTKVVNLSLDEPPYKDFDYENDYVKIKWIRK